jgi:hypothetical protein
MMGEVIFNRDPPRNQLISDGEVVIFRSHQRTTGRTWWSRGEHAERESEVSVEEIGTISDLEDLQPYLDRSGFVTLTNWLEAIERPNGYLPATGWLYRVADEDTQGMEVEV